MIKNILLLLCLPIISWGKTVHIAVIDTGFSPRAFFTDNISYLPIKFCSLVYFYKDFQIEQTNHGTEIISILSKRLNDANVDYCIHLLAWDPRDTNTYFQALEYLSEHMDSFEYLNLSLGGFLYNKRECVIIKKMIQKKKIVIAAAGNSNANIDKVPYYPASCDLRIFRVMNGSKQKLNYGSNYTEQHGFYENGQLITGLNFNGKLTPISGTSVSAVIFTANTIIYALYKKKK